MMSQTLSESRTATMKVWSSFPSFSMKVLLHSILAVDMLATCLQLKLIWQSRQTNALSVCFATFQRQPFSAFYNDNGKRYARVSTA